MWDMGGLRRCPQGRTKQPSHPARRKGETGPSLLPHCPALAPQPPGSPRHSVVTTLQAPDPEERGSRQAGDSGGPEQTGRRLTSFRSLAHLPAGGGRVRGWTAARTPPAGFPAHRPSQRPGAHRAGPPGRARFPLSTPGTSRSLAHTHPPGCELWGQRGLSWGPGRTAAGKAPRQASLLKYLSTWKSLPCQWRDSLRMA